MYDVQGDILYVGKARNLKNRVSSYFRGTQHAPKTKALVQKIDHIDVTVTLSETEALLLEQTLIKSLKPPFNILLRDDKSYPYIYLSKHEFPRLAYYRGAKNLPGRFFGPFPSAVAVRETLSILQKIFKIRQCEDSFYKNRSRPCLQYQIGRCKAPCVGFVSEEEYNEDLRHTVMFLEGKSSEIHDELTRTMHEAAEKLEFEKAAELRDQLAALAHVQAQQFVEQENGSADVFGVAIQSGIACVQIIYVRGGRALGNKSYFPSMQAETEISGLLEAFVPQYYLGNKAGRDLPRLILVPEMFESAEALTEALQLEEGRKVAVMANVRGVRAGWQRMARTNAEQYLASHLANRENLFQRFEALRDALNLDEIPGRLECFDISHTMGEGTVASCVVFEHGGPLKSQYRRFNIEGIQAGDDYAAMQQALERRYIRLKKGEARLPDILIIDGGKGQMKQAMQVLSDLQIQGVLVLGVAKGETRKPGLETLFLDDNAIGFTLDRDNPGLHLIQHIRDEAHRFAITGHRQRRAKTRNKSVLEQIPGLGPKRRRELLRHFGGQQEVQQANVEQLAKVSGISTRLAQEIYAWLHNE